MRFVLIRLLILVAFGQISYQAIVKPGPGFEYENCGPPFKLTLSPNPPKLGQTVNVTVEGVAAHDLIAGIIEAYFNFWPYYLKKVYCDDARAISKGCYIIKGENVKITKSYWLDDSFKETNYMANATVRNEDGELLLCFRVSLHF